MNAHEKESEPTVITNKGTMTPEKYEEMRLQDQELEIVPIEGVTEMHVLKPGDFRPLVDGEYLGEHDRLPELEYICQMSQYGDPGDILHLEYCTKEMDFHGMLLKPGDFYGVDACTRDFIVTDGECPANIDGFFSSMNINAWMCRNGEWSPTTLDLNDYDFRLSGDLKERMERGRAPFAGIHELEDKLPFRLWAPPEADGQDLGAEYNQYYYGEIPGLMQYYLEKNMAERYAPDRSYIYETGLSLYEPDHGEKITELAALALYDHQHEETRKVNGSEVYQNVVEAKEIMDCLQSRVNNFESQWTFEEVAAAVNQINEVWGTTLEKQAALYAVAAAGDFWISDDPKEKLYVGFSMPKTEAAIQKYESVYHDIQEGRIIYAGCAAYEPDYMNGDMPSWYNAIAINQIPVSVWDKDGNCIGEYTGDYKFPSVGDRLAELEQEVPEKAGEMMHSEEIAGEEQDMDYDIDDMEL